MTCPAAPKVKTEKGTSSLCSETYFGYQQCFPYFRFFTRTNEFIDEAVSRRGIVVVNCVMGWSRSATVVAAYLMTKKGMTSAEALETIRSHRPIRPNPGFLQQLANYENLLFKRLVWT
jgi:protein-tyrosine phosphatase